MHPPRFSVLVLPNVEWRAFLRRCREVEDLGFDAVALADHLVDWAGGKGPWLELWTQLAAVAMATTRVRVASLVAQIPLRNPVTLAHQALTADHIAGGRLDLGLGIGLEVDPSYRMMGIDTWTAKQRVARFSEYVELVDRLLREQEVTFCGQYYQANRAALSPRAVQSPRPPITIAAMGPKMLRLAARYADSWNSLSMASTFADQVEETRQRIATINAHCATLGRDPATLRHSYLMFDPGARSSAGALTYFHSEATFASMARQLMALGISELVLYYPMLEQQRSVFEQIARNVIPALKS